MDPTLNCEGIVTERKALQASLKFEWVVEIVRDGEEALVNVFLNTAGGEVAEIWEGEVVVGTVEWVLEELKDGLVVVWGGRGRKVRSVRGKGRRVCEVRVGRAIGMLTSRISTLSLTK